LNKHEIKIKKNINTMGIKIRITIEIGIKCKMIWKSIKDEN